MNGFTSCFGLSKVEVQFALEFPGLNSKDKTVWMAFALLNAEKPDYSNQLLLIQLCKNLKLSKRNVLHSLKKLEDMGFLTTRNAGGSKPPPTPVNQNSFLWKIHHKWFANNKWHSIRDYHAESN